jgi:hypothetical protein
MGKDNQVGTVGCVCLMAQFFTAARFAGSVITTRTRWKDRWVYGLDHNGESGDKRGRTGRLSGKCTIGPKASIRVQCMVLRVCGYLRFYSREE